MQTQNELYHLAKHLDEIHLSFDKIEEKLHRRSSDSLLVESILKQVKKEHYAAKRKSGLIKMGIALALMLIGFCITCFNFHSNISFTFVMYAFTAAGLILLMWGLYDLVG